MAENEKREFLIGFGQRVKQARIKSGLTLEVLANALGYCTDNSRSTMQKIESGRSDLGVSKVRTLTKVLNVSVSYLMGWDEPVREVPPTAALSPDEQLLLDSYRSSDDDHKRLAFLALGVDPDRLKQDILLDA